MRPLRHLTILATLALVLSAFAAPAAASHDDARVGVQAEGQCTNDGDSRHGSSGATVAGPEPGSPPAGLGIDVEPSVQGPEETAEDAGPCVDAVQEGGTPDGGSYAAVTVAHGPAHLTVSTVPVTDAATDAGVREPGTDATAADATISGACNSGGSGGSGDLGATVTTGDGLTTDTDPDSGQDGAEACLAGATGGSTPDGGSHLAADATAADGTLATGASTVPATDLATGQSDSARTAADAAGACRDEGGNGGEDSAHASADIDGSHDTATPHPTNIRDAAVRCAANVVPGPGSYLQAGANAADGLLVASVDTVPLTNLVGGSGVTVEGACYYEGAGAQASGGVGTGGIDLANPGNVVDGVTACATAASNGSAPAGGSYVAVTVTVADDEIEANSAVITDHVTAALP